MRTARRAALGLVALVAAAPLAACGGLFAGTRPAELGPRDGRLAPVPEDRSNAVSSFATSAVHRIEPFDAAPDPRAAFARLREVVASSERATIVAQRPDYLYAEFRTRWMGFVDDVEFLLDEPAKRIHVRSASRLGRRDFGVNRERVQALRTRYAAAR
ncbi:MAG: hypothetical protein RJA99_4077 [Pseudomonadota bacterium]|jgi:uncharacterized protein (DUF1499 family)